MAQVIHTWVFNADAEGLTDHGDSANVAFSFVATDGSPSSGCVKFQNNTTGGGATETARSASGHDWTYWGVPAGVNVTAVQVTAYKAKTVKGGFDSPPVFSADIVGGSTVVHPDGSLFRCETNDSIWTAQAAGSERAVDAAYQAASTSVQLRLTYTGVGGLGPQAAFLDTLELTLTYDGGGTDYVYTGNAKEAILSVAGTVFDAIGTENAKGAIRAGGTDILTGAAETGSAAFGISSATIDTDAGNARVGLASAVAAENLAVIETLNAAFGTRAAGEDVPTYTPRVYSDYTRAVFGVQAGGADVVAGQDRLLGRVSVKGGGSDSFTIVQTGSAKAGVKSAVILDGYGHAETLNARFAVRVGGSPCLLPFGLFAFGLESLPPLFLFGLTSGFCPRSADAYSVGETVNARFGLKSATAEVHIATGVSSARFAAASAAATVLDAVGTANAKLAMRSAATAASTFTETGNARFAARVGEAPCLQPFGLFAFGMESLPPLFLYGLTSGFCARSADTYSVREGLNGKFGVQSATAEVRIITEAGNARFGLKNTGTVAPMTSTETVGAAFGLASAVTETSVFTVDDLIRTLRAIAKATLSEIKSVPEGMPEGQFSSDLPLPYLLLVAMEPREDGTAVFSNAMWVPVDFVYIVKNAANRDNPQYARDRLNVYADEIARDFHLGRGTGAHVANDTNITATPYSRLTHYQQIVSEAAQNVTAMALTGEFRLVHDVTNS